MVIRTFSSSPKRNAILTAAMHAPWCNEVLLYRFNGCSYAKSPAGIISEDRLFYIQIAAIGKYQSAKELAKKLSEKG